MIKIYKNIKKHAHKKDNVQGTSEPKVLNSFLRDFQGLLIHRKSQ